MCSSEVNGGTKPIDLFLARLKPGESWVEDRTVADLQIAPDELGIGVESPIEMGNSKFARPLPVDLRVR